MRIWFLILVVILIDVAIGIAIGVIDVSLTDADLDPTKVETTDTLPEMPEIESSPYTIVGDVISNPLHRCFTLDREDFDSSISLLSSDSIRVGDFELLSNVECESLPDTDWRGVEAVYTIGETTKAYGCYRLLPEGGITKKGQLHIVVKPDNKKDYYFHQIDLY